MKETRSSTTHFENKITKFKADRSSINSMQYLTPDNYKALTRRHEHVGNIKLMTILNWQDKVEVSDERQNFAQNL